MALYILQEGLTALDVARGGGYQAVCEVLEQYTKQETMTELTEVSQQLWFVNHCCGQFSDHNYDRTSNEEGLPQQTDTHTHTHANKHMCTLTLAHSTYTHPILTVGAKRVNLSEAP